MKAIWAALAMTGLMTAGAMAQTADTQPRSPRTLTMSGEGEARATPDTVMLSAGVTTSAPTAAAALSANTAQMERVFAALKRAGIADRNMQTSNFSVSPEYAVNQNGEQRRLTGYQVNNQLRVRLDDVARLGTTLDALVTAGANQMYGIEFSIREPQALLDDARAKAVAEARAKAEVYARAAGVTLGSILSISESGEAPPRPMMRDMVAFSAAKAVPVAAGEEVIRATVSIIWEIR